MMVELHLHKKRVKKMQKNHQICMENELYSQKSTKIMQILGETCVFLAKKTRFLTYPTENTSFKLNLKADLAIFYHCLNDLETSGIHIIILYRIVRIPTNVRMYANNIGMSWLI